ncbi:hypothetical protein BH23DEI1_BH23DEI1_06710 [soil metagenome]
MTASQGTTPRRLLAVLIVAALVACGQTIPVAVNGVQIIGGDRTLPIGATALLTAAVAAQGGAVESVTWSSSDTAVATVDANGFVNTSIVGSTTITATSTVDATKSDTVTIVVSADPDAATTVDGIVTTLEGAPAPLAVGLMLIDFDAPVLLASVTEIEPGTFVGPLSPVDADGAFTMVLPDGAGLPDGVFTTADDFVLFMPVDCSLDASAPEVRVTGAVFEFVTIPGVALLTANGLEFAIATDQPADPTDEPSLYDLAFQTWVYAEDAVEVQSMGTGCDDGFSYSIDVSLTAGWNQLSWTIEYDALADTVTGVALRNSDVEDVFVLGIGAF